MRLLQLQETDFII